MKKTFALVIATLFILASLAACTPAVTTSSQPDADPTTSTSAAAQTTASIAESDPEPSDNDAEIKHNITILGRDRRFDFAPISEREEYPVWGALVELLAQNGVSIDLELVAREQYPTFIQTRMAAGSDLPDIVNLSDLDEGTVIDMGDKGLIIDIKTAVEEYSNGNTFGVWDEFFPSLKGSLTTPTGNIYWYPSISATAAQEGVPNFSPYALSYRGDWAAELDIAEPQNTAELVDMIKAFRDNDANKNGATDEIIVVRLHNFLNGIAQSFGLAPMFVDINDSTGKAVTPWEQPGIKPYIEFMRTCLAEGLIDASLMGATDDMIDQVISENKAGLVFNYAAQSWLETMTGDEDGEFVPFILQGQDDIQTAQWREFGYIHWDKMAITQNADVEGAVLFFDAMYSEEYKIICLEGVEGVTFEYDEDGIPVKFYPDYSFEQAAEERVMPGGHLWANAALPFISFGRSTVTRDKWIADSKKAGLQDNKIDFSLDMLAGTVDVDVYLTSPRLALPSAEEREILDQYFTVLNTYSDELLVNLILGEVDIDQIDAELEKMNEMGLDQILTVYQDRHDRYKAAN